MPTKIYTAFQLFVRQCLLYPLVSPFLPPVNKVKKNYSYANNALTGTLECAEQKNYPADQQFIDNGDGTVSDLSTGLMWAKDGNGAGCNNGNPLKWEDAIDFAEALEFAGYDDWYLPEIKELETIVDYGRSNPAIDPTYFPASQSDRYWSSTTYVDDTSLAWFVNFYDGYVFTDYKGYGSFVRPVRQY